VCLCVFCPANLAIYWAAFVGINLFIQIRSPVHVNISKAFGKL